MSITDIRAEELRDLIRNKKDDLEIIDVREPDEYRAIHIKGSKLIPLNKIKERAGEVDWNKEVIFICRSGSRSKLAAMIVGAGHDVKNLRYGIYECFADGKGKSLEIDEDMIEGYF